MAEDAKQAGTLERSTLVFGVLLAVLGSVIVAVPDWRLPLGFLSYGPAMLFLGAAGYLLWRPPGRAIWVAVGIAIAVGLMSVLWATAPRPAWQDIGLQELWLVQSPWARVYNDVVAALQAIVSAVLAFGLGVGLHWALQTNRRVPSRTAEAPTAGQPTAVPDVNASAGWYADPTERHEQRYWNGSAWTESVSDTDPLEAGTTES